MRKATTYEKKKKYSLSSVKVRSQYYRNPKIKGKKKKVYFILFIETDK